MRPLWRPTRSRQRDTGEAKRVERPVESGEGEPPLAAVGVPGVAPRLGQESLICPQVQVPKASSSSLWRTKPKGGLGIRATRTLLHRLSALAGATAFGSEFSLRVQVAWTVQADCPVAYEELFSSPHVDVVHSLSNCKRWIPGLKTMIEFCRFVNRTIISDPGGQFPDMQLTPSSSVSATVLDFKNQLKWDRFTWVGIHVMRLAAELHLRSGNHTAEGLAPLSSYMYEMMMLKYKHDPGDKPLRFLIISEDKGAVAKLTEMAAPAFQRNQFVPWTRQGMNITFGLNTKEGLKTSAADIYAAEMREAWGRLQAGTVGHLSDADARVVEREAEAASGSQKELDDVSRPGQQLSASK
eukprot:jgi/Tetstr1/434977/TSEL_023968.t1